MKKIEIIGLLLLLVGCSENYDVNGFFWGSSPKAEARYEASMQYNDSVGEIHRIVPADYAVYVVADTHIDSTANRLDAFVKAYKLDPDCRLVLHLGDLIRGKGLHPRFFASMAQSPTGYVPGKDTVFYALGNHDLYFGGWTDYEQYVGTTTYWFDTRTVDGQLLDLFICIDSGEATFGKVGLIWLRNTLEQRASLGYRHIIVFSHTNLFYSDGSQGLSSNMPMEETYELMHILSSYGVDMYWNGHDHDEEYEQLGGVEYYSFPALIDGEPKQNRYAVVAMSTLTIDMKTL